MAKRKPLAGLRVDEFQWDEENEEHCARHELDFAIAEEVRTRAPLFFRNKTAGTGTHQMTGPDAAGISWTVVILNVSNGLWRPITGFRSLEWQIKRYNAGRRMKREP